MKENIKITNNDNSDNSIHNIHVVNKSDALGC